VNTAISPPHVYFKHFFGWSKNDPIHDSKTIIWSEQWVMWSVVPLVFHCCWIPWGSCSIEQTCVYTTKHVYPPHPHLLKREIKTHTTNMLQRAVFLCIGTVMASHTGQWRVKKEKQRGVYYIGTEVRSTHAHTQAGMGVFNSCGLNSAVHAVLW